MAAHPARRCGKASAKCLNVRCCVKKMERNEANKGAGLLKKAASGGEYGARRNADGSTSLCVRGLRADTEADDVLASNGQMCPADGLCRCAAREVDLQFYGNRR
ncbi:hypothetical protein F2P81_017403 [Scophthalmus maximus]|uniref:Uncharacterized protein n=1 Tax=Scophthalmus maximus TaxID=52904 RepID=A0A6A4SJZ1_SCOMX|nr:hypothetical protein F2P81_017403 [Scophthalmus maximus]